MIPDLDGYEIARSMRSSPDTETIPIIMFTARSQVDDKVEGLEAGADAYITKPARPKELFAQVNSILKRAPQRTAGAGAKEATKGKLIGVMAAKGGIGISTLAINLALEIHNQSAKKVLLADFRPGQGTISMELDVQNTNSMIKLLEEDPEEDFSPLVANALMDHKLGIRTLLSSHHPSDSRYLTHIENFYQIAKQLAAQADYAVLDLGPSLSPVTARVLPLCDKILICLEPSPGNVSQTRIMIQDLINSGIGEGKFLYVLINRQPTGVQLSWEQAENQLEHKIDQIFTPVPELAYQAAATNTPMIQRADDSMTAEQFHNLAQMVLD
jgi:cellulose biosynthesis protein BcsQ